MSAARIELPDFMTARLVEKTYQRAMELKQKERAPFWNGGAKARRHKDIGVRMAIDRHPKLLLFLDKAAEHLRAENEQQKERFEERGFAQTDFSEYSTFREAFIKADEPLRDEYALHNIFCWVYAAVAEALGM